VATAMEVKAHGGTIARAAGRASSRGCHAKRYAAVKNGKDVRRQNSDFRIQREPNGERAGGFPWPF